MKNHRKEFYTKSRMADHLFERYISLGDLSIFYYNAPVLEKEYLIDADRLDSNIRFVKIPKLLTIKSFFSFKERRKIKQVVKKEVIRADKIIIRVPSELGYYAYKECMRQNKPFLVEVVGNAFDGYWNHSFPGKFIARNREFRTKKIVKNAKYAIYVSENYLQEVYPTKGISTNASNVVLKEIKEKDLTDRLTRINNLDMSKPLTVATSANLNVKFKGQHKVIQSFYNLKKQNYRFKYYLWGAGSTKRIERYINKYNMHDDVVILGLLSNEEVQNRLKDIDIYIQPSKQEGLPRALIEAMSKGCLCFGTSIAGIPELLDGEFLFDPNKFNELENKLKKTTKKTMINQAHNNFKTSKKYNYTNLQEKRNYLYSKYIND